MGGQGTACVVTGGAGFIGSHLCNQLVQEGYYVSAIDNFSTGYMKNLQESLPNNNFRLIKADLLSTEHIRRTLKGAEVIFHLAANPEVRTSMTEPEVHFRQNIVATFNLLEEARRQETVREIHFTSSSSVYGDAEVVPTPETWGPLRPISVYGASKLACEALICSYAHGYGLKSTIYRLANVVGPRSRHGVIFDLARKIGSGKPQLEVLGDGNQVRSYLHIDDCMSAFRTLLEKRDNSLQILNVGSYDNLSVKELVELVVNIMSGGTVEAHFTGGVDGGRGWIGDAKKVHLDISRIRSLGWEPKYDSREAVQLAVEATAKEITRRKTLKRF